MKKVILTAFAALALVATSFAQAPTAAPAPMAKMGNKAKTKATDAAAPAQQAAEKAGEKAQQAGDKAEKAAEKAQEMGKGNGKGPDEARGRGEGRGGNMLGLSAEQETKFRAINEAHKAAMNKVQSDASMAADAKKAEMELLKSKYESDVQQVLTTDQFAKWKEMRAKRGERREGGDRKEGGRKPDGAAMPAPADTPAPANAPVPTDGMKMKNKKKNN
jgi:hypothetical protein